MEVKLSLAIIILIITVAISDPNMKTKLQLLQNSLSVPEPFTSSEPPLLHVVSCFVQEVRIMTLIVVNNSNADMIDGLLRQFYKQFNVPVLLLWVQDDDNTHTETPRDMCNQCAEINIAYIIIVDDVTILHRLWDKIKKAQFVWNREANFLLLVTSPSETTEAVKLVYGKTLEFLWRKYKMLHVLILPMFTDIRKQVDYKVMFYQPFVLINNNTFGENRCIDASNVCSMCAVVETVSNKLKNMNGYPFHVSMFPRGTFVSKTTNKTEFYYGQDGYILSELASYMGFSTTIHHPPLPKDFGFYYSNGTSTGTLGFVLHGKAEIAFNARFIKNYGTKSIAFTSAIFTDDLCIIVPKASYIPKWLAMVISFDKYIYAMIVIFYLVCGTLWYTFKQVSNQYNKVEDAISLFLDTLHPYVGMSFTHIPKAASERILMTCSLILGLILASAFQGQLVNAISKPTYYPDINTLQQLDKSGLRITTSSRNLHDSFADTGNAVLDHLRNKLTVVNDSSGQDRVARRGNVAALVRKSTVGARQSYRRSDGSKLVHLVSECPRSYYLSYVMFKNSPYLSKVNRFLIRIFESGIITQIQSRSHYDLRLLLGENTTVITEGQIENSTKVFTVEDLQLPFILLAAGLSLACLVFLTEML